MTNKKHILLLPVRLSSELDSSIPLNAPPPIKRPLVASISVAANLVVVAPALVLVVASLSFWNRLRIQVSLSGADNMTYLPIVS